MFKFKIGDTVRKIIGALVGYEGIVESFDPISNWIRIRVTAPSICGWKTIGELGIDIEDCFELISDIKHMPNNVTINPNNFIGFVISDISVSVPKHNCECGAHACKDQFHSTWCPEHVPIWKNR